MTTPRRVVLDTNVVLSALLFSGGAAGQLRWMWQGAAIVPLASAATAGELVRVLGYPKFALSEPEQLELLADYLPYVTTVRIGRPPPRVPPCRDPMDAPFLHVAVAGNAQVLVSGDKDLLAIAPEFEKTSGCKIVDLQTFLRP